MPLFVAKGVLLRVLRNQLARRHLYLGLKTNQTHQGFYMCLGGFHNNLALINLDLQSFYFKRNFRIMLHFLLRNYRFCFISNHIREFFNKAKLVFHYHLVFDYWISGSVSNYKNLSKQEVRKTTGFLKRMPQVIVGLKLEPYKIYNINKETIGAGIPMFCFLDTNLDVKFFSYFFPVNTKQLISFNYCIFLLSIMLKRAMIIKKTKFLRGRVKVGRV